MKKPFNKSIDYYILPNKIFCSIAGMWPIDEKSSIFSKIFAYVRLIFGLIIVNSFFIPQIIIIVMNWKNIKIIAGIGCVLTTITQVLFKMIYLIARREKTYSLYYKIRNLWNSSNDSKERPYEEFAYWARIFSIIFYSSCMCNVFTFSIAAAIDYFKFEYNANNTENNRHLPFIVWYRSSFSIKIFVFFVY